jgi:hypothetical protein
MSEELLNNEAREAEIRKAEEEKVAKINASLNNIQNKTSKFIFCVPESQSPAASIYEIYFHATIVKKMGYTVLVMVEKGDYTPPAWIEKELTDHKHMSMADPKLNVGPEDIMVIPEVYSNIMEQTKNLPCLRIGLLQSIDYMINSLVPGSDWRTFGITEMITTSATLKNFVESYFGVGKFNIKTYNIGIPDYFEKSTTPQKPIISVIGRNPNEISKFVKLFFSKFPQYSWVTFDPMLTKSKPPQSMRRIDFARRLQGNFAAVWIDRIASFGTFPLECMKCGTIPVCLKPDIIPDYMITRDNEGKPVGTHDGAGVWTDNYYDLPLLAGEVLIKFLDDSILPALYESMDKVAEKYTQKNAEAELVGIYQSYVDQRIMFLQQAIGPKPQIEQK